MKTYATLRDIQHDRQQGILSTQDLVRHHLENIRKKAHLNAFLSVYEDEALDRAREVDHKIKAGTAGKLAGLVVGLKDVLAYKDHPLQASSKILDGFNSQFNGTAVQRLLDEDAVIIGRQNCDEFAMGSSNENSAFGPVLNDADNARVPGGSGAADRPRRSPSAPRARCAAVARRCCRRTGTAVSERIVREYRRIRCTASHRAAAPVSRGS